MKTQNSAYHIKTDMILAEQIEIDLAKKDLSKFSVLYERYYLQIFKFIYQRVETELQAAEICSDVFIKVMENLKTYKTSEIPFASWLYRIARNTIYTNYKQGKKFRQVNFSSNDLINLTEETYEEQLDKLGIVVEALKKLSHEETELIEMKYFEKRTYFEISNIMGITENNAKIKTFRVIQKLKQLTKLAL